MISVNYECKSMDDTSTHKDFGYLNSSQFGQPEELRFQTGKVTPSDLSVTTAHTGSRLLCMTDML